MTISLFLSGGSTNATPSASLGGAISTASVPRRLFSPVTDAEFTTGVALYRCVYVSTDVDVGRLLPWIGSETPLAETTVALGWGTAALNGVEQAVASGTTAPAGVSFASPTSAVGAANSGLMLPGDFRSLWLRYTVTPVSPAPRLEHFSIFFSASLATASESFNFSLASQYIGFL